MPGWWRSRSVQNVFPRSAASASGCCSPAPVRVRTGSPPAGHGPAAGQAVPVDELGGSALTGGAQLPQRRRAAGQDAELVQGPVEQRAAGRRAGPRHVGLDVEQLQDVADGDLGDQAALGGQDQSASDSSVWSWPRRSTRRIALTQCLAAGRIRRGHGTRPCRGPGPPPRGVAATNQPVQRGPEEIGADQHRQRRGPTRPGADGDTVPRSRSHRGGDLPPVRARGVGAAGQPAVLPGHSRLGRQPVQQQPQPATRVSWPLAVSQHERCAGQPRQRLARGLLGGWPACGPGAGRN